MWGRKRKESQRLESFQEEKPSEGDTTTATESYSDPTGSSSSIDPSTTTYTTRSGEGSSSSRADLSPRSIRRSEIAPQFKKLGVDELGLTQQQLVKYKDVFDAFKDQKTGLVTVHSLVMLLAKLGKVTTQAQTQQLLEGICGPDVKAISFAEFSRIMASMVEMRLKIIVAAFKVIDENGLGFLSAAELGKALERIGLRPSQSDLQSMMDDCGGTITLETFARKMGFQGEVPRDMLHRTLLSISQTDITFADDDTGEESMLDEAFMLKFSEVTVTMKVFYLNETFRVKASGRTRLQTLAKQAGKHLGHPPDKLRLYYRGHVMLDLHKTLAEYLVKADPVIILLLPVSEALSPQLCWETVETSGSLSSGDGSESSNFFGPELLSQSFRADNDARVPNLRNIYNTFRREGLLREVDAVAIVKKARAIMENEDNLLACNEPVSVIGDIHGQFFDLDQIVMLGGAFSTEHTHLFLGDYVDRGVFSCEVILYLLAAKVRFPKNVLLLRGNHESRKMTKVYGFHEECVHKYSQSFYNELVKCFDSMPLACVVTSGGKRLLMLHGGISPRIESLSDIEKVDRFHEPPMEGALREILWTDPWDDEMTVGKAQRPESYNLAKLKKRSDKPSLPSNYLEEKWGTSERSRSLMTYGHDNVCYFLAKNQLLSIFRGHEQKLYGHEVYKDGPVYKFPSVVTVFSAPNYTDKSMNDGTIAVFEGGMLSFVSYKWRLHPVYHPYNEGSKKKRGTKDIKTEDFIQFVNFLHPESLLAVPMAKLKREWFALFMVQRAENVGDNEEESSSSHSSSSGSSSYSNSSSDSSGVAEKNWKTLAQSLMTILAISDDPEIVALFKKKSQALIEYYEEVDHFAESLASESEYERDFDSPEVQSRVDTAYESDYVNFVERQKPLPDNLKINRLQKVKGKAKGKGSRRNPDKGKEKGKEKGMEKDGKGKESVRARETTKGKEGDKAGKTKDKGKGKDKGKDKGKGKKKVETETSSYSYSTSYSSAPGKGGKAPALFSPEDSFSEDTDEPRTGRFAKGKPAAELPPVLRGDATHSDGIIADMMKQQRGQTSLMEPYAGSSSAVAYKRNSKADMSGGSSSSILHRRKSDAPPPPVSSGRRKRAATATGPENAAALSAAFTRNSDQPSKRLKPPAAGMGVHRRSRSSTFSGR